MKKDPDEILDWKESKFYLWFNVAQEKDKDEMLMRAVLVSYAVWEPKKIPELLKDKKPMSEKDKLKALRKAEKIKKLEFKETI